MKRILSMIGGGFRGVATAAALQEKRVDPKGFDMLAGTSAGAINAAAFACGYSPAEVVALYKQSGAKIFDGAGFGKEGLLQARHSAEGVESVLKAKFGERRLGGFKQHVVICTWLLQYSEPACFRSWVDAEILVWKAVRASSAAPVYFPPFKDGDWFWDGGMATNDPTLKAIIEAWALWPDEELDVLTVGTGTKPQQRGLPWGTGAFSVGKKALDAVLDGNQANIHEASQAICQRLGYRYRYANAELPGWVNPAMDDVSEEQFRALVRFGEERLAEMI